MGLRLNVRNPSSANPDTNQLQRLCVLLDVYLETESHDDSVEGPKEFPQEKMCLRLFR